MAVLGGDHFRDPPCNYALGHKNFSLFLHFYFTFPPLLRCFYNRREFCREFWREKNFLGLYLYVGICFSVIFFYNLSRFSSTFEWYQTCLEQKRKSMIKIKNSDTHKNYFSRHPKNNFCRCRYFWFLSSIFFFALDKFGIIRK